MPVLSPHLLKNLFHAYGDDKRPAIFVETGSYLGDSLSKNSFLFKHLYSIEVAKKWYNFCSKRFSYQSKISLFHGQSVEYLEKLLPSIGEPTVFWLDAHYAGGDTGASDQLPPILEELKIISSRKQQDIIIIDDAKQIGKSGYTKDSPQYPQHFYDWEKITIEAIAKALNLSASKSIILWGHHLIIFTNQKYPLICKFKIYCSLYLGGFIQKKINQFKYYKNILRRKLFRRNIDLKNPKQIVSFKEGTKQSELDGVTLITPTGDRPETFALCEQFVSRQSYTGNLQWIVVDDGKQATTCTLNQEYIKRSSKTDGHTVHENFLAALDIVKYPKVIMIEDDDWYHPDYIQTWSNLLDDNDLVGQLGFTYYNIQYQKYFNFKKIYHSALSCTGFNSYLRQDIRELLCERSLDIIDCNVDHKLWNFLSCKKKFYMGDPLCVGLKGLPGRPGSAYGRTEGLSHFQSDTHFEYLKKLIGYDYLLYSKFVT